MTGDYEILNDESYAELRKILIRFLRGMGSTDHEDLADETISRVLKNLNNGEQIRNLKAYSLVVARNVYLESVRRAVALPIRVIQEAASAEEAEILDRCLSSCLKRVSKENRQIIDDYYVGSGISLIERRQRMAETLGITMEALRLRAYRIRQRLRLCVEECRKREN